MSTADPLRNTRLAVRRAACPECCAKPGQKCVGANQRARTSCHSGRWNAYRDLTTKSIEGAAQ